MGMSWRCTATSIGTLASRESAVDWLRRRIYTAGEGEFWALSRDEAAERLLLGQRWFAANRWPLAGFVPPAWLLSPEAWLALRAFPAFSYVTTFTHVHALHSGLSVRAPCLTFSTRAPWRRTLSRAWATVGWVEAPLARLALHPQDAAYPELRRAWQRKLDALLQDRTALTKAEAVRRLATSTISALHRVRKPVSDIASGKNAVSATGDASQNPFLTPNAGDSYRHFDVALRHGTGLALIPMQPSSWNVGCSVPDPSPLPSPRSRHRLHRPRKLAGPFFLPNPADSADFEAISPSELVELQATLRRQ